MKVLCIQVDTETARGPETPQLLVEGNSYTVVDVEEFNNFSYYSLSEISAPVLFNSKLFIPCSGIDETEMVLNEFSKQSLT